MKLALQSVSSWDTDLAKELVRTHLNTEIYRRKTGFHKSRNHR